MAWRLSKNNHIQVESEVVREIVGISWNRQACRRDRLSARRKSRVRNVQMTDGRVDLSKINGNRYQADVLEGDIRAEEVRRLFDILCGLSRLWVVCWVSLMEMEMRWMS